MEVTPGKTEKQKTLRMSPVPLPPLPFSPAGFGCHVSQHQSCYRNVIGYKTKAADSKESLEQEPVRAGGTLVHALFGETWAPRSCSLGHQSFADTPARGARSIRSPCLCLFLSSRLPLLLQKNSHFNNEGPLYSAGNYTRYAVRNHNGKEFSHTYDWITSLYSRN